MSMYKLRLDHILGNDLKQNELELLFTRYIRVFELGVKTEKPHFHYYIETDRPRSKITNFIVNKMGLSRKYSMVEIKDKSPVEYIAYILKYTDYKKYYCSSPDLEELIKLGIDYDIKVKSEIKQKKAERLPVWKQCEQYVLEQMSSDSLEVEAVASKVLDFYITKNILVRRFQIISIVETILIRNSNGYKSSFLSNIISEVKC